MMKFGHEIFLILGLPAYNKKNKGGWIFVLKEKNYYKDQWLQKTAGLLIRIRIGSGFNDFVDPDSESGSGSGSMGNKMKKKCTFS
jgi:hypothetical protein